ncbi:hypothetical protein LINPERPRIM_LOCUS3772 [Linum perenne]
MATAAGRRGSGAIWLGLVDDSPPWQILANARANPKINRMEFDCSRFISLVKLSDQFSSKSPEMHWRAFVQLQQNRAFS